MYPPQQLLEFEPTRVRARGPRLRCSLIPAIHPEVESAHRHTLAWAIAMGLVERHSPSFDRLCAARFSWLAARSYPLVDTARLELISDWITFLFAYDDLCDAWQTPDLQRLADVEDQLIGLCSSGSGPAPVDPLVGALADILRRAGELAVPAWLDRLGARIRDYIHGCRWERSIQRDGQVPSLATYTKLRLLISAVFPCFDLAGLCIDGRRTDFVEHVLVQQLEVMANNHICWVNDIYGIDRDCGQASTSNLVIILAREQVGVRRGLDESGLAWDLALNGAIELCNREFEAFAALAQLVRAEHQPDSAVLAYVAALEAWMRGNLDWYADTRRYRLGS